MTPRRGLPPKQARRGRDRRAAQQRRVPESARPQVDEVRPPAASEWLLVGVMGVVLPVGLDGPWWLLWLLRLLGAAAIVGFVVARIRYRVRRGEGLWLWHRI